MILETPAFMHGEYVIEIQPPELESNPLELIAKLKNNFGEKVYDAWLSQIRFSFKNQKITLESDNQFVLDYVNRNYAHSLYKNGKVVRTGLLALLQDFYKIKLI